ncbi:MAG: RluA family pseudouridine synthase [Candidatus Latescibacterota bacterium]|nr:RluA family pseudouridine synthase [Candidatus Latescibacterota bacterium]MEE3263802.1 RluA family pseudouridine synthase [Candidatus Latescibacterota bacterium]MEE3334890.1 RluA family pseudouridine synthase [Candidatus Latescibacterota bacterium]
MSSVPITKLHTVDDAEASLRLDVFLQSRHEDLSRSRLQGLIADGDVSVNGAHVRSSYRVRSGDAVELRVPKPVELGAEAQDLPLDVVYEDEALLVVDKPSGMAVHPAPGTPSGTLVNALLHHCNDLSGINGVLRPGIVHRLDRDTTGLLVVAKNDEAHRVLAAQLEERQMVRRYIAVVWGRVDDALRIEARLARHPKDRLRMAVVPDGRHAVTHVSPGDRFSMATQIDVRLETGRTHQIRVHLQHVGHPVFGDPVYGGRTQVNGIDPALRPMARHLLARIDRQALHARLLGFEHPDGRHVEFTCPPPDDFNNLLDTARGELI